MHKLSYPPQVRAAWLADPKLPINIDAPISEVIKVTAKILNKGIRDVVVMLLDRPRNQHFIDEIRRVGASLRMIGDGDIAAALAPALKTSHIDLYVGIGGRAGRRLVGRGVTVSSAEACRPASGLATTKNVNH